MILIANNTKYLVSFTHDTYIVEKNGKVEYETRGTVCTVKDLTVGNYAVNSTICSIKDTFNKAIGRKIALLRALKALGLNKTQRTEVWKEYFTKCKK